MRGSGCDDVGLSVVSWKCVCWHGRVRVCGGVGGACLCVWLGCSLLIIQDCHVSFPSHFPTYSWSSTPLTVPNIHPRTPTSPTVAHIHPRPPTPHSTVPSPHAYTEVLPLLPQSAKFTHAISLLTRSPIFTQALSTSIDPLRPFHYVHHPFIHFPSS